MENNEKILIGIISWLPDNEYRTERIRRCRALIEKCEEIFGVPIAVVAQNWRQEIISRHLIRLDRPKLGITRARKLLWEYFGRSEYEWMICFDDDCRLEGNAEDGRRLLSFLTAQPGGYVIGREYEFKLCALHRTLTHRIAIPDLDVCAGTGIEDYAFFRLLEQRFPRERLAFEWGSIRDASRWPADATSSWPRRDIGELLRKTEEYIGRELKKDNSGGAEDGWPPQSFNLSPH